MKKLYTLIFSLLSISTFAQPTLTSAEMAAPGTTFKYKHVASFAMIDTTQQGASQTWNYSSITATTDPEYTYSIIDPNLVAEADSFPTANYGILEDGTYYFFNRTTAKMERVGSWDAANGYIYYTDPQTEYVFPLALGVQSTDASLTSNSSFPGSYTLKCIGYGTLNVPGHTYPNVLMTRTFLDLGVFAVEVYVWYDSNNGMAVFQYVPGDGGFIPEAAIFLDAVVIGVEENNFASNVFYNNPVSTILNLNIQSETPANISYSLINSLGKIVRTGEIEKNQFQQLSLDLESESAGLYFLNLRDVMNANKQRSVKIIKN
jgi:hypothetical protein